jgi:hypothetical protein
LRPLNDGWCCQLDCGIQLPATFGQLRQDAMRLTRVTFALCCLLAAAVLADAQAGAMKPLCTVHASAVMSVRASRGLEHITGLH